jgi:hypothetical protein
MKTMEKKKIHRNLKYPSYLTFQSVKERYILFGILHHKGLTPNSGHYYADVLDEKWVSLAIRCGSK